MKTAFNKKSKSVIAVYLIITFVYILAFVIIPFHKNVASWISFAFTIISFAASLLICAYAFKDKETLVSKIYGFPIFRIGYLYAGAQFVLSFFICLISAFVDVPYWIALLLSVILAALAAIGAIVTDNTRDIIEKTENETEYTTKAAKIFNLDIATVVDICEDEAVKSELEKLNDLIKFSDPVSNEETEETETQLLEEIRVLRQYVENNETENSLSQIKKTINVLNERNRICKAFKK